MAPPSWIKMLWRTLQVSGFIVHLKYTAFPLPQRRDFLIMDYAMSQDTNKEDLSSIARVRGRGSSPDLRFKLGTCNYCTYRIFQKKDIPARAPRAILFCRPDTGQTVHIPQQTNIAKLRTLSKLVCTMAASPCPVTPRNLCAWPAALIASIATCVSPPVPLAHKHTRKQEHDQQQIPVRQYINNE